MKQLRHRFFQLDPCSDANAVVELIKPLYLWYSPRRDESHIRDRLLSHPNTEIDLFLHDEQVAAFGICYPGIFGTGEKFLFRHGTIVHPEFQSLGLYRKLIQLALDRHSPRWLTCRTQNPRLYETWWKIFKNHLLPRPNIVLPDKLTWLARELSKGADFDPSCWVIKNVYYEDRSEADYHRCREAWIQQFFQTRLGVHDAMILLARTRF